ncbi:MAG: hypothetical protein ACFFDM_11215, partial [Candidatus Thorarchaeota archaeon]
MKQMLARGAESIIYKIEQWGQPYVLKWRQSKPYLLLEIDSQLRRARINRECKMLTISRTLGVRTPAVHAIDLRNYTILMDFIDGTQFKQLAGNLSKSKLIALC